MKNIPLYNFIFLLTLFSCNHSKQKAGLEYYNIPPISNLSGEKLAQTYCGSCHKFPEPDLLDKNIWKESVLPKMSLRLGMGDLMSYLTTMDYEDMQETINANIFPEKPVISQQDWDKIQDYYLKNAPQEPIPQKSKKKIKKLTGFIIKNIKTKNTPLVTLVKWDSAHQHLYVGLRDKNRIDIFDKKLKRIDSIHIESPVSDILFNENGSIFSLHMGIMDPNDQKKGILSRINPDKTSLKIIENLRRPVHIVSADFNQDIEDDLLICQFGNELGRLSWWDGRTKNEHILKDIPGARICIVKDINNDQLLDIVVLMTQSREGVLAFINKENGTFEETELLSFSPVYGSTSIELVDFNKDGFDDILYTNGDNGDISFSMKRYHGVRIFSNNGHNIFKEDFFYPMYGASKAMTADFDLDGDMDIAAISFFTHPEQNESFIYFENQGNGEFLPKSFEETKSGRWMVMDIGDVNADGYQDIILGSFMLDYRNNPKSAMNVPLVSILENRMNTVQRYKSNIIKKER